MFIANTEADTRAMLERIGVGSVEELYSSIPAKIRLHRPLDIPAGMSEMELTQHVQQLATRNRAAGDEICFLGGGSYDHFIPALVDAIASRSEFYTSYTPYQAEASQGNLQAFYEFQTLICQLTGMDVANASLYEGGSAVAEAVMMAMNITNRNGKVIVPESLHPEYRATLATYLANLHIEVMTLPTPKGFLDPEILKNALTDQTIAVIVQQPNFFGCLEEAEELTKLTRECGAIAIISSDPISLGLLKRPGDYGADIVVGEGQSLGTPMGYGGPYLGLMACRKEHVRRIPGRLVGETVDRNGNRCWVLTLQAREQHIRREKATSNICTNQGLYALRCAVHLTALGPQGLRETAELCLRKAHYAAEQLSKLSGLEMAFDRPFFREFTLRSNQSVPALLGSVRQANFHAGLHLGRWYPQYDQLFTVAVTEKRTRHEIDALAGAMQKFGGMQ